MCCKEPLKNPCFKSITWCSEYDVLVSGFRLRVWWVQLHRDWWRTHFTSPPLRCQGKTAHHLHGNEGRTHGLPRWAPHVQTLNPNPCLSLGQMKDLYWPRENLFINLQIGGSFFIFLIMNSPKSYLEHPCRSVMSIIAVWKLLKCVFMKKSVKWYDLFGDACQAPGRWSVEIFCGP